MYQLGGELNQNCMLFQFSWYTCNLCYIPVCFVWFQDPKRHLEEHVDVLMTTNIVQCLGAMLHTVVFKWPRTFLLPSFPDYMSGFIQQICEDVQCRNELNDCRCPDKRIFGLTKAKISFYALRKHWGCIRINHMWGVGGTIFRDPTICQILKLSVSDIIEW